MTEVKVLLFLIFNADGRIIQYYKTGLVESFSGTFWFYTGSMLLGLSVS